METPGSEKYAEYEGSLTVLGTEVRYFAFQIYNREQASVCEVFFTLSNPTVRLKFFHLLTTFNGGVLLFRKTILFNKV